MDEYDEDEHSYHPTGRYSHSHNRSHSPLSRSPRNQFSREAYRSYQPYTYTPSHSTPPALSTSLSTTTSLSASPNFSELHHESSPFGDEKHGVFAFTRRSKASPKRRSIDRVVEDKREFEEERVEEYPHSSLFDTTYTYVPAHVIDDGEDVHDRSPLTPSGSEGRRADSNEETARTEGPADMEWTPTCTQSLRRQWQAISLRFRFGVFRAQRKMRRRVHSLL